MNIYFLVEGKRTEKKVYPKWLSYLIPELRQIKYHTEVKDMNYYLFDGGGYPSLLNHIQNAILDINDNNQYNYLVICLDAEDVSPEEKISEIETHLKKNKVMLKAAELLVIVQNKCIETWMLGNKKVYVKNPQNKVLKQYTRHYNVKSNDPELMKRTNDFETDAQFHYAYLNVMFSEKGLRYTKNNPGNTLEEHYLKELINRVEETGHLKSFSYFLDFCKKMKEHL